MDKQIIEDENKYLKKVLNEISKQKKHYNEQITGLEKQKKQLSLQYSEDYYTMDDEEALIEGDRISEFDNLIMFMEGNLDKLNRQEYSPYFGRVDFSENGKKSIPYYIGVHNLIKDGKKLPLVCDWRAPVSSLFYDYEMGRASFDAPDGTFYGDITLKRQYEIKNKQLKNVFDSSLTIADDILKSVLSQNASKKMRTIVSTIQKEQNKIIRADKNKNMLVQGVAGSGKTSIALHRIAYLLYQNKNTLKAEDMLILSPNKLFSEYIAQVLPELGEENISQMSFYRLAQQELKFLGLELEKREENLEDVCASTVRLNEVAYKNTYEFFESLQNYCLAYFDISFKPQNLVFGNTTITADEMLNLYNKTYQSKTPAIRVEWLVDYIVDKLDINQNVDEISKKIKAKIYPFFEQTNVINIYADFLSNIGMKFTLNKKEQIRYEDLGAILYISNYFFGLDKFKEVKYLIIDEMQDYSFPCYAVINSIFDCNKTILGDINQCIEKVMSKDDLQHLHQMIGGDFVEMTKAFRSTYEITSFASKIKGVCVDSFERHGDKPHIIKIENLNQQVEQIVKENEEFNSIAILTKNTQEAKQIYEKLSGVDVSLNLSYDEQLSKVCIMPSYMAKGLEFDVVVIPYYTKENYCKTMDLNMLYVSATRALHKLYLLKM